MIISIKIYNLTLRAPINQNRGRCKISKEFYQSLHINFHLNFTRSIFKYFSFLLLPKKADKSTIIAVPQEIRQNLHKYQQISIQNHKIQTMQIEENKQPQPPIANLKQQAIFLIHGITSLIGWCVVLNSLDYFHQIYNHYDVYAYFLLSILIGFLITAASYRKLTSIFNMQRMINVGLIVCTISLLLLLVTALIFKNVPKFGFLLSLFICIMVGISSNIVQLSYFAMINFVPEKVISRFTIGTALSGLSLTIIRMIITAIAGTTPHIGPIFIYFLIACTCQIVDLFLNNIFCKSQYFLDNLKPYINRNLGSRKILNMDQSYEPPLMLEKQSISFFKQLVQANKKIFPYPLIIFANYVITMMLFPDLTVKIKFHFSKVWSSLIFIFLFGLGDALGKFLVEFRGTFNQKSNHYLIIARIIFFFIIPVLASGAVNNDPLVYNPFFPFFVLFLFGFTAGFIVSSSIILVSKKCEPSDKELSGVLCGISIQIGLTVGTIMALPMQFIAPKQITF